MSQSIEFEPSLELCIQTLAKREFNSTKDKLLENEIISDEILDKLEVLSDFLENTDFNQLRREYEPFLVEGKRVIFGLKQGGDKIGYEMEVR